MTLGWPYWRSNPAAREIAGAHYLGARGGGGDISYYSRRPGGIPGATPDEPYRINSMSVREEYGAEAMMSRCDEAFDEGGWFLTSFHGIDDGRIDRNALGWDPLRIEHFRAALDYIEGKDFWIATFGEVLRYIEERNSVSIDIEEYGREAVSFVAEDGLDDEVFCMPLSIEITLPAGWEEVTVHRRGLPVLHVRPENGRVSFDVYPDGSTVTVRNRLSEKTASAEKPAERGGAVREGAAPREEAAP
jgi:oligosaccharide reducing-end xylanase